jgi:hypothetical protein
MSKVDGCSPTQSKAAKVEGELAALAALVGHAMPTEDAGELFICGENAVGRHWQAAAPTGAC